MERDTRPPGSGRCPRGRAPPVKRAGILCRILGLHSSIAHTPSLEEAPLTQAGRLALSLIAGRLVARRTLTIERLDLIELLIVRRIKFDFCSTAPRHLGLGKQSMAHPTVILSPNRRNGERTVDVVFEQLHRRPVRTVGKQRDVPLRHTRRGTKALERLVRAER